MSIKDALLVVRNGGTLQISDNSGKAWVIPMGVRGVKQVRNVSASAAEKVVNKFTLTSDAQGVRSYKV